MSTESLISTALQFAIWRQESNDHRFVRAVPPTRSVQSKYTSLLMDIEIKLLINSIVVHSKDAAVADQIDRPQANQAIVLRPILEVFEKDYLSSHRL